MAFSSMIREVKTEALICALPLSVKFECVIYSTLSFVPSSLHKYWLSYLIVPVSYASLVWWLIIFTDKERPLAGHGNISSYSPLHITEYTFKYRRCQLKIAMWWWRLFRPNVILNAGQWYYGFFEVFKIHIKGPEKGS